MLLGMGAELAAPENRTDGDRIIIDGRQSTQDTVNQVGQEITKRNQHPAEPHYPAEFPDARSGQQGSNLRGPTSPCSSSGARRNERE